MANLPQFYRRSSLSSRLRIATIILLAICLEVNGKNDFRHSCVRNDDCHRIEGQDYLCNTRKLECEHRPLYPLSMKSPYLDSLGYLLVSIVSALSNAGGVGGGGILMSIFMVIYGYSIQDMIPLSSATMLSGAVINMFMTMTKPHHINKDEFLIDYGLSSIVIPLLLAGTVIGVILAKSIPTLLTIVLLTFYFIWALISVFKKTMKLSKEEKAIAASENQKLLENNHDIKQGDPASKSSELLEQRDASANKTSAAGLPNAEKIDDEFIGANNDDFIEVKECEHIPDFKEHFTLKSILLDMFLAILALAVIIVSSLLRGGPGMNSVIGISSCSYKSWLILLLGQLGCLCITYITFRKHAPRLSQGASSGGIGQNAGMVAFGSYMAGLISGLLGLGGGMVLNPLFLHLGIHAEVSVTICSFTIVFAATSNTIQFIIQGMLYIADSVIFLVFSGLGAFFGSLLITHLVRKYKKPSILLWILMFMMVSSMILIPAIGIYKMIKQDTSQAFRKPC